MIEVLIKIIEKLTELIRYRNEADLKCFSAFIDPMYQDLKTAHHDYLKIFESCRQEILAGTDLSRVVEQLMEDRLEQEALRRSIATLANTFGQNKKLKQFNDFFFKVMSYFYSTDPDDLLRTSLSSELLQELIEIEKGDNLRNFLIDKSYSSKEREIMIDSIDVALEKLRKKWIDVSQAYADILSATAKK